MGPAIIATLASNTNVSKEKEALGRAHSPTTAACGALFHIANGRVGVSGARPAGPLPSWLGKLFSPMKSGG